ncbi:cytochrome P450 51 [Coccidioides immitis RS]|uniref:sterol 14alpha-demethylase n=3 Tax=Coccidioides immitis TaxID=5501 RepID=A0A0E1RUY7_COCIM|nr:cytochrome P450 51 [Coccidioides immitis RS]EAS28723.1 cytochrome P450 51 [Coccidioides immitis RS]KMP05830.1 cytochrome P450 51 [Coccidioides immitis RMSCC 2394]KMU81540.1 cytochrome P450 51 [Coccidioides immitis RMSCC 3703]TPX23086.1 Lanosterol 14-alpha-demethylase [Coccidioides immitis]
MGLLANVLTGVSKACSGQSPWTLVLLGICAFLTLSVFVNVLKQVFFKNPNEPPVVFHWFPIIGSTISYGIDPYKFFFSCQKKYGDIFTFILLGKKTTVFLGTKGNDFILNGKLKDVCAEEVYSPLTTPVFGRHVVYDCPNAKLMEQKKFVKFGLTSEALRSYVTLITREVESYLENSPAFQGDSGVFNVAKSVAEITIYTASRSLQGKEVRDKFDSSFAELYADLDMGFAAINFMFPWAPLPHNRKRDRAQQKMTQVYTDIIRERRKAGGKKDSEDMVWNLMSSVYKDGTPVPDVEVAHMMIALLMAGQHSSASTGSWIVLRLASRPDILEELYQEQLRVLGPDLPPLTYESLQRLELHSNVIKETLRLHAPIHSILRAVKSPMPVDGTKYVVPTSHNLLAAPGVPSRMADYFPEPMLWDPHRWEKGGGVNATGVQDEAAEEKVDYGYGLVSKGANSPYLPFGSGRHRCIGEQFAYVQLGTITAALVRALKLRKLDGDKEVPDTDYSSLFSKPLGNPKVAWEKRKPSSKQ